MGFIQAVSEVLRIQPSHVKDYLQHLGRTSIPRGQAERIALYRAIQDEHYRILNGDGDGPTEAELDATTDAVGLAAQ